MTTHLRFGFRTAYRPQLFTLWREYRNTLGEVSFAEELFNSAYFPDPTPLTLRSAITVQLLLNGALWALIIYALGS